MSDSVIFQQIKETIPSDVSWETVFDIVTRDVTPFTHGFHKYPAKFIPQIPKWAIAKYLNGKPCSVILDPFCGSGTTLVEGALAQHNVIGIDIDPLSIMISKVKTTKIDTDELDFVSRWIKEQILNNEKGTFSPECNTLSHWFTKDAIEKLSKIRTVINKIPEQFGNNSNLIAIQNLLLVCFSSIIRRVSNADNESQKTYVSHTRIKEPEETYSLFFLQLDLYIDRIKKYSAAVNPDNAVKIIQGSAAEPLASILQGSKIDLVVTSPPYIKAIDYIYNQMVELFWVGDLFQLQTQTKQNAKKKEYIGNKLINKAEYENYSPYTQKIGVEDLDGNLQAVFTTDKKNGHKHSYITYKYFTEMESHFLELSRILEPKTHYIFVVGNSSVSEIFFDSADYLGLIAERNGFKLVNKWGYKIKNRFMRFDRKGRGGKIEIDWVLDFAKI